MTKIDLLFDATQKGDGNAGVDNALNANERLQRDLDQACLKTIVSLLAQLPLQPPDGIREADLGKGKASMFFRYFTFFIKLLNRCRVLEVSNPERGRRQRFEFHIQFVD